MNSYVTITFESLVGSVNLNKLKELNQALDRGEIPSLQGARVVWDGSSLEIEMDDYLINYNRKDVERFCEMLAEVIREGQFYITFPENLNGYVVTSNRFEQTVLVPVPKTVAPQVYEAVEEYVNCGGEESDPHP